MTTPSDSGKPWWIHLCHWLWVGLTWFWGVILLGVGLNVGSTWLTSQSQQFRLAGTPLGWLLEHLSFTIPVGVSLFVLTAFAGLLTALQNRLSPSSSILTLEQQNRVRFLAKLRDRYVDILESSLQGVAPITLGLHRKPDAIINTTRLRSRQANLPEQPLPVGASMLQVYDQSSGELLILGGPGAGKTTLLLYLAQALCQRAEQDVRFPLPVIVHLSTWATMRVPFHQWLVEEIARSYDVPRRSIARWVEEDLLLPLLDGLDEVSEAARSGCIEAINAFKEHHLIPLVVCSRTEEYIVQRHRLVLHNAVMVQPLDDQQVDEYFSTAGKLLTGIRSVIRNNAELRELVRTPLMLHVLTLAYWGVSVRALPKKGPPEEQQRQSFASYVERMFEHRGTSSRYPKQQTMHWLTWLSKQMVQRSQTIFYLEQIQPDWLSEHRLRRLYETLLLLVIVLVGGLFIRLDVELGGRFVGGLTGGLIGGLGGGLTAALPLWLGFRQITDIPLTTVATWPWELVRKSISVGLGMGLLSGLLGGFGLNVVGGLVGGLIFGIVGGLSFGLAGEQIASIRPAEVVTWSRESVRRGLANGLAFALLEWLGVAMITLLKGVLALASTKSIPQQAPLRKPRRLVPDRPKSARLIPIVDLLITLFSGMFRREV